MRSSVLLSLLLTAVYEVAAFEKTSPFLAWSSNGLNAAKNLNAQVVSVQDLKNGIYDLVDCSHKAILVVDELELHASDLGRSGRDKLKYQIQSAGSSLQIPFVQGAVDLEKLGESLSQKCHTPFFDVDYHKDAVATAEGPSVFYKKLTSDSVKENDQALDTIISEVRDRFQDNYLVLYSTSQTKEFPHEQKLSARQLPEQPPSPTPTQSGLFHHYTFFSQGIFMGLLVAFIIVPIGIMGIFWNLSVQQPQRFEKKQN
ncbi:hypothetical protein EMPS_06628 [Entomortierella parvispora]|uniref:Protein BIG1 n=1 Tax=Entomortierella parvispora TaxID=205924 RepID=A0A9P3HD00_9FUNG|nr:hypothetical protein EMPS_06628 [Entomortierella parvispora]